MTDFVTRDDTNLGVGRILTSPTMYALYDNVFSLASGGLGAPRIQTAAIQDEAVTTAKLAPPVAGKTHLIMRLQEVALSTIDIYPSGTFHNRYDATRHLGVTVLVPGVITAYVQHRSGASGITASVRVLKNGAVVQAWSMTTTSFVVREVNVTVDVGDVIIFQQNSAGSGVTSNWQALRIYSNSKNMAVA